MKYSLQEALRELRNPKRNINENVNSTRLKWNSNVELQARVMHDIYENLPDENLYSVDWNNMMENPNLPVEEVMVNFKCSGKLSECLLKFVDTFYFYISTDDLVEAIENNEDLEDVLFELDNADGADLIVELRDNKTHTTLIKNNLKEISDYEIFSDEFINQIQNLDSNLSAEDYLEIAKEFEDAYWGDDEDED